MTLQNDGVMLARLIPIRCLGFAASARRVLRFFTQQNHSCGKTLRTTFPFLWGVRVVALHSTQSSGRLKSLMVGIPGMTKIVIAKLRGLI